MCNLPDAAEGGRKTQVPDSSFLEVAYHLVPGLEGLSGVPRKTARVKEISDLRKLSAPGVFIELWELYVFGPEMKCLILVFTCNPY